MGNRWQFYPHNFWIENLVIPAVLFLFFLAVSKPLTGLLFRLLHKTDRKDAGENLSDKLEYGFRRPLRVLLIGIGVFAALCSAPSFSGCASLSAAAVRCFRSFLVLIAAWGLYRMADSIELTETLFAKKFDFQVDKALLPAFSGIVRFIILAIALLIVAQEWNYSISGLLAGLGLGGLAFALAAKDLLTNLFGGLVILMDRPFTLGDWIQTGDVEGIVEEVNFRSVKVRTFSQALVTVPNGMVTSGPVLNFSRMGKRRLEFTICLKYGAPAESLKACEKKIRRLLAENGKIESESFTAALDGFGENGLNLTVACYTKTTDWQEYVKVREDLFYAVLNALEEEGIEFASSARTIRIEKKDS